MPVASALLGNAFVTLIKFTAALISGSSAMFAEAIHSLADTANQTLLLIGLHRSLKKPDVEFEYGYGRERFFWALISACGIFFIGAGITAYKGTTALIQSDGLEFHFIIIPVLLISLTVESYTLLVAHRELKKSFPELRWTQRLKHADPSTLSVYFEDAVAVLGVVVASISITLSYYTGNGAWDAGGSIVIAILLAFFAIILIIKNRSYLIGHAMPENLQDEIIRILKSEPAIEKIIDFKSTTLGWGQYRIKFEVEFNGVSLLREDYQHTKMREEYKKARSDFESFKRFYADYADRIPRLMGKKIDEIEKRIKEMYPAVRHIDIEIN